MARRRDWGSLSDSYRKRLTGAGITRSDYEAGVSVTAARGHAHTPERPARAAVHPERYQQYLGSRDALVNRILRLKRFLYSHRPKWSEKGSRAAVQRTADGAVRSMASLRRVLAELEKVKEAADEELDRDYAIRHYNDIIADVEPVDQNAFFYH